MASKLATSTGNPSRPPQASVLPCKLPTLDGSLTLLHTVGSGSYGKVYLGQTADGSLRAAKCIPLRTLAEANADSDVSPESEPTFLKLVKHRNVIRLYDSKVIDGRLWLSMEFACRGTILNYLAADQRKSLTEVELAVVAHSVLSGLKCMHKRHVIHRDVKPGNILITYKGKVKLGDLGTACVAVLNRHSVQGTFQYLAPEIFHSQSYDSKVDIWALGMTILELAQGFNPFQSEHIARVLYHLVEAPTPPSLEDPSGYSPEFLDFLNRCLTLKSSNRPTAAQLLKHPFLKKAPKVLPIAKPSSAEKKRQMANLIANGPSGAPITQILNPHAQQHAQLSASQDTSTSTSTNYASSMDSSIDTEDDSEDLQIVHTTPTKQAHTGAKCFTGEVRPLEPTTPPGVLCQSPA